MVPAHRIPVGREVVDEHLRTVVLAEALYRAFSLLKGHPYHRAGSPSGL